MESIITILNIASTLSPLAIIALLVIVVMMLVKAKNKNLLDVGDKVDAISNNHLHGLPDMADSLDRIESLMRNMNDNIIFIKAKLTNGGGH